MLQRMDNFVCESMESEPIAEVHHLAQQCQAQASWPARGMEIGAGEGSYLQDKVAGHHWAVLVVDAWMKPVLVLHN